MHAARKTLGSTAFVVVTDETFNRVMGQASMPAMLAPVPMPELFLTASK